MSFIEAGEALRAIRDSGKPSQRLYRKVARTFPEYLKVRWDMSEGRATQYILAVAEMNRLETFTIVKVLPTNEAQVRELIRLPEEHREEAWEQVVQRSEDESEPITAKMIRTVR